MKIFSAACLLLLSQTTAMAACTDVKPLVCRLPTAFDPNPQTYQPPPIDTCTAPGGNVANVIQNAFVLASDQPSGASLKDEICALKKIFIVPGYSWGFREVAGRKPPPPGEQPRTFVAIQESLLVSLVPPLPNLDTIEKGYQTNVLKNTPNPPISFSSSDPDTPLTADDKIYLGILGVLAHEIGHIKWHHGFDPTTGCYPIAFTSPSWSTQGLSGFFARTWAPPPPADDIAGGTSHVDHPDGKVPFPYQGGLGPGQIRKIYDTQVGGPQAYTDGFVTAFAAASPEEDFVETYRIVALKTNTKFRKLSLQLTLGGGGGNPIEVLDGRNDAVKAKMSCVQQSFFGATAVPPYGNEPPLRRR